MIRWNSRTNTLILQLPRWRNRRVMGIVLFLLLLNGLMAWVDLPLAEFMMGLDEPIKDIFRVITEAGDSKYYLVPLALLLPFLFAAKQAIPVSSVTRMLNWGMGAILFVFTAVAASGLLVNLLKIIFGRARPRLWFDEGLYGFAPFTPTESLYWSFPSGHSNTAFTFAMAVAFLVPQLRRYLLSAAFVVAFSRVVLTKHYLSDILAGGAIGIVTTYWLREQFASRGWVFLRRRGEYQLAAPGYLLGQKLKALLWQRLGLRDGARGRLPR